MNLELLTTVKSELEKMEAFNARSTKRQIIYGPNLKKIVSAPGKSYHELEVVDCTERGYGILNSVLKDRGLKVSPFSTLNTNNIPVYIEGELTDMIHNLSSIDMDLI